MTNKQFYTGLDGFFDFVKLVGIDAVEEDLLLDALKESFMPFRVSRFFAHHIASLQGKARRQVLNIILPTLGEKHFTGRFDPYGNRSYASDTAKYLQHKYPKTLLFHPVDFCNSNCQFCYKVSEIRIDHTQQDGIDANLLELQNYCAANPEIDNILFTGGDPLAFKPAVLLRYLEGIAKIPTVYIVRLATKMISFDPQAAASREILSAIEVLLEAGKSVVIVAHINHPAELSLESFDTIYKFLSSGCQVRGQPAIVRGVNDDADVLAELHRLFLRRKIQPYYFTTFMPVKGVEQYGLKLHESYNLYKQAVSELNGLEKRSTLLASHDWGKLEIIGFLDDYTKIVLRWQEVARKEMLPSSLSERIPCNMHDVFVLDYVDNIYSIDALFMHNKLTYIDAV